MINAIKTSCVRTLGNGTVRFKIGHSCDTGNYVLTLVNLPAGKFKTGERVTNNTVEHLFKVNDKNVMIEIVKSNDGLKGLQVMMTNIKCLIHMMEEDGFTGFDKFNKCGGCDHEVLNTTWN